MTTRKVVSVGDLLLLSLVEQSSVCPFSFVRILLFGHSSGSVNGKQTWWFESSCMHALVSSQDIMGVEEQVGHLLKTS